MGQSLQNSNIQNKLIFVSKAQDQFIGPHQIFRMEHQPHDYILKLEKVYFQNQAKSKEQYNLLYSIMKDQHKAMAHIHWLNLQEQNLMCSKHIKLQIYENYYNFSLRNAIRKKKTLGQSFKQAQIWYIVQNLIQLSIQLKRKQIAFANFNLDNIFISPQGITKLYSHQLLPQNKHHSFYKAQLGVKNILLAPQAIQYLPKRVQVLPFDLEKFDMFTLSICILCIVYMQQQNQFYKEGKPNQQLLTQHIQMISSKLSDRLQIFLNYALQIDPFRRISFVQAINFIRNIRDKGQQISTNIRLKIQQTQRKKNSKQLIKEPASKSIKIKSVNIYSAGNTIRNSRNSLNNMQQYN